MGLIEYNTLQSEIIKKYQLLSILATDSKKFNLICSLFSQYRELKSGYTATKNMIRIVRQVA